MRPTTIRPFALPMLLAGLALGAAPATAAELLKTCHVDGIADLARCGEVSVPENPEQPSGKQLKLPVIVLPATGADPAPDPIYLLAGGPGQAARDLVGYVQQALKPARKQRDLVFVDVRGTGGPSLSSGHPHSRLDCPFGESLREMALGVTPGWVEGCLATLSAKADLRHYSTYQAMRDLDLVRAALGHERINLWGGSYGTRAGMVYQALFPERIRSVVLDGLAPYGVKLPLHNAREAQRALDLTFADCAADPVCRNLEPAETLRRLRAKLDEAPVATTVKHPATGEPTDLLVTPLLLGSTIRVMLYSPASAGEIPFVLRQADRGDWGPLVAQLVRLSTGATAKMSAGFLWSVLCSEDIARIGEEELLRETAGTFLGRLEADSWMSVCAQWPKTALPEGFEELPITDTPALLLSGSLDPVVPPVWGEATLKLFRAGRHLEVPGTAHNTSHVGCMPKLIAQFYAEASAAGLDPSCLSTVKRTPFQTSFAGSEP